MIRLIVTYSFPREPLRKSKNIDGLTWRVASVYREYLGIDARVGGDHCQDSDEAPIGSYYDPPGAGSVGTASRSEHAGENRYPRR